MYKWFQRTLSANRRNDVVVHIIYVNRICIAQYENLEFFFQVLHQFQFSGGYPLYHGVPGSIELTVIRLDVKSGADLVTELFFVNVTLFELQKGGMIKTQLPDFFKWEC